MKVCSDTSLDVSKLNEIGQRYAPGFKIRAYLRGLPQSAIEHSEFGYLDCPHKLKHIYSVNKQRAFVSKQPLEETWILNLLIPSRTFAETTQLTIPIVVAETQHIRINQYLLLNRAAGFSNVEYTSP
jgi:hypothetical protein